MRGSKLHGLIRLAITSVYNVWRYFSNPQEIHDVCGVVMHCHAHHRWQLLEWNHGEGYSCKESNRPN